MNSDNDTCRCNNCMTVYQESDLTALTDENGPFNGCGVCGTDAYLMADFVPHGSESQ